jgi:L-alanine-DL-glutamate epimerase-like enolase superfamily enzyme
MKMEIRPGTLKLRHEWTIASALKSGGATKFDVAFVRLADRAITGLGECSRSVIPGETFENALEFLKHVEPSKLSFDDLPGSLAYLDTLSPHSSVSKASLDIALLDGAARKAGKAIYDFLGLGFTENKHITSFTIGIDTPEIIRRKTLEAAPYPILKLKVGGPNDRENLAALRQAAPAKKLRLDANEGWTTKEQALRNIQSLATDPNIEFVEQPMPASTPPKDLAWLKERSPLPLYADESCRSPKDIELCAQCYHGVNVKLVKTGGIIAAFETLKAARKANLQTMVGCMIESSILITAAAHLSELSEHLDIDGNLLISNDPFAGATAINGVVSFASASEKVGLRVRARSNDPFESHS